MILKIELAFLHIYNFYKIFQVQHQFDFLFQHPKERSEENQFKKNSATGRLSSKLHALAKSDEW